jgi:flagellar protein FliO/FliZ
MPVEPDSLGSLSLTIAAVVLLLWGALWAVRRWRPGAGWSGRDCAVLRSLVLGPRERLLVVRVGGRQLVIGVGSAAVSLLCELDEPLSPPPTATGDGFGEAVRKAMKSWRGA